jgi:Arc/MetJ-type ribon-helix-helix transcriptional regulator
MTTQMKHIHITMPRTLRDDIDHLVGKSGRYALLEAAIMEKLARIQPHEGKDTATTDAPRRRRRRLPS